MGGVVTRPIIFPAPASSNEGAGTSYLYGLA